MKRLRWIVFDAVIFGFNLATALHALLDQRWAATIVSSIVTLSSLGLLSLELRNANTKKEAP